ncbi:MAG TPA: MarR family transcriptional regulator [Actinomycetes bacterium]|nr:MarR family transcriptional regulator [Actinomycetes bacterium]
MALVQTAEAFLGVVDQALRDHGLSRAGRQALAVIDGAGEPLSPTAIADRLIVTTASVTSLLDTLERKGLLMRRPDPDDRRRLHVVLTDAGREAVEDFLPQVVALQTAALSGLAEAERQTLLDLLRRIEAGVAAVDARAVVAAAPRRGTPRRG